jgi:nucleoside-diphosphate-sugar epimerase
MRLLVLGGTVFLGRALTRRALAAGHEVTCVARGNSGAVVDGARFVAVDRDDPDASASVAGSFDAVIDVTRRPSHARRAVAALRDSVPHAVFVSSMSVYSDVGTPGQRVGQAPTFPPLPDDDDESGISDPTVYGRAKVASEIAYREGFGDDRAFICRAGLIEGPEDVMNRYAYWVRRIAAGGEVLAPGRPDETVQLIDVRDLADWLLRAATERIAGTFDGTCPPMSRVDFLTETAAGVGSAPQFTWVSREFLDAEGVRAWAGARSLPVWVPVPDFAGFMAWDVTPSFQAGLTCRPLSDTARDMWAWLRSREPAAEPGISRDDEAALLRKWRSGV